MVGVAEKFKSVINEMTYATYFKHETFVDMENVNLTNEDLTTGIEQLETRWNIYLTSNDAWTSRAKPSSNSQLTFCEWSIGIADESHWNKMKNRVGWQIAINTRIVLKQQVTAMLGCHSHYDWCYQTMWLYSGVPEDPQDDTGMEKNSAETMHCTV